jgi:3-deoxy-7-phosphoheptulonate synthase
VHDLKRPITRIGRIAGQYAKPRSEESETVQGVTLPSYRGDIINSSQFSLSERTPDPRRMLKAYHYSAMTLNHLRTLINNGFADLHHPEYWNLNFSLHPSLADKYHTIEHAVKHTENLTENINFYTSHEALLLPYEEAMTQQAGPNKVWYNLGTHFPWVGMRTAKLDSAHIEYLRGIANPIAIKVGPEMHEDYLIKLIDVLNPQNEPGRLTLIHRLGAEKISETLPRLINAVKTEGKIVLWSCDPMHGNTRITRDGIKTRKFDDILLELTSAFQIHQHMGTYLGGIHVELTGEDVTECTGGARGLTDDDLKHAYQSQVDPRLNYEQSLEMAMLIVQNQG